MPVNLVVLSATYIKCHYRDKIVEYMSTEVTLSYHPEIKIGDR